MKKGKNKKSNQNFKKLPLLKKKGICVYLCNLTNTSAALKKLFDLFEGKNAWRKRQKLSQEGYRIGDEIASYFYFATVNRIWGDQKWDLSKKEAYTVLDTLSDYLLNVFYIENPSERLKAYRNSAKNNAKGSLKLVSDNIIKILKKGNRSQSKLTQISTIISCQLNNFFIRLEEIPEASEEEMDAMIKNSIVNFPRFLKI